MPTRATSCLVFVLLAAVVVATRITHSDLLWIEEAYPMAAAAEVLRGKVLYRDIWFDKPPLYALFYTLWGATPGWPVRIAGSAYILMGCVFAWRLLSRLAGPREGLTAAALLAVYLTFDIPSAVMALAPDLLTLPLHFAAVSLAMERRSVASGIVSGVALLFNTKAVFVLAACLLWASPLPLIAGFLAPNAVALGAMGYLGALGAYVDQVWAWGTRYSRDTFIQEPFREFALRTANWAGFHAAIVIGAAVWLRQRFSWRIAAWIGLSVVAVCAGLRFFPRYYFHLLPPVLFAGARGLFLLRPLWRTAVLCTVLIPVIRFGPRYAMLASGDRNWSDLSLMQDSRAAAEMAKRVARPGDRLLVWGYRPDVFVLSGLPAATRFLDSQPLNGVLADRHLATSVPTFPDIAERSRLELRSAKPDIIVDGLGPLNPNLAVDKFPDLELREYQWVGSARTATVYVRKR